MIVPASPTGQAHAMRGVVLFLLLNAGLIPLVLFPRWLAGFTGIYEFLTPGHLVFHALWIDPLIFLVIFANLLFALPLAQQQSPWCASWLIAAALWFQNGSEKSLSSLLLLYRPSGFLDRIPTIAEAIYFTRW